MATSEQSKAALATTVSARVLMRRLAVVAVVVALISAGFTAVVVRSTPPAGASTQQLGTLNDNNDPLVPTTSPSGARLAVQVVSSGTRGVSLSADGGSTWSFIANPSGVSFSSIAVSDTGELYGVAYGAAFYRRPAGGSWQSPVTAGSACDFGDPWIVLSASALIVNNGLRCGQMYKSTNNGASWTQGDSVPIYSHGTVIGGYVHIVTDMYANGTYPLSSLAYLRWNIGTGHVDVGGIALAGGLNGWSIVSEPGSTSHLFIAATDDRTWDSVARHGLTIYESINSGATWTLRVSNEPAPAYLGMITGFAMGGDGRLNVVGWRTSGANLVLRVASRSTWGDWSSVSELASVSGISSLVEVGGLQRADGSAPSQLQTFGRVLQSGVTFDVYAFLGTAGAVSEPTIGTFTTSGNMVKTMCGCTDPVASPGRAWEAVSVTAGSTRYIIRSKNGTNWDQIEVPSFINYPLIAINDNGELYAEVADTSPAHDWPTFFYRFTAGRWFGPIGYGGGGTNSFPKAIVPLDSRTLLSIEGWTGTPYLSIDNGNNWRSLAGVGDEGQFVVSGAYLVRMPPPWGSEWSRVNWVTGSNAPVTSPPTGITNDGPHTLMAYAGAPGNLWVADVRASTQQVAIFRSQDDGANWATVDSGSSLPSGLPTPTVAVGGDGRLYGMSVVNTGGNTWEVRQASRSLTSSTWSSVSTLDTFSATGGVSLVASADDASHVMPVPADFWVSFNDNSTRHYGQLGGFSARAPLSAAELYGGTNRGERCGACLGPKVNFTKSPVTASTGNFWHTFNELSVPGRGPALDFSLTYNSLAAASNGPAGYGWRHSYQMDLSIGSGDTPVVVSQENGAQLSFDLVGSSYVAPPRVNATLTHNGDGTWTLVRNQRETFVFDSGGKLTTISDRNGYTTTLAYAAGKLATVTDPAGRTLTFAYTGSLLTTVTDTASTPRTVQLGYTSGNLTSITDVGGKVTTMSYDGSHQMLEMLDPNQQSASVKHYLTNVYTAGKVTSQTDFEGRETTFDYTSIPGATKVTDPKGNVTVQQYTDGLPTRITRGYGTPSEASWTITYDPASMLPTETVDPNGHKTVNAYDARGNLLTRTTGLGIHDGAIAGRTTTWTYNGLDEPLTMQDSLDVTTTYTYDTVGNLTSVSTPINTHAGTYEAATYAYADGSHPGDVTSMTDPRGEVWQYGYDAYGLRATVTDPTSKITKSCYDNVGRRTRLITPKGIGASVTCTSASPTYTTQYTTNAYGDVLTTIDALGHQTVLTYDDDRNLASAQDGNGHQTTYDYNRDNELIRVNRPSATPLETDYWEDGSLKSQTDGNGQATQYAYDPLGHISTVTDPLSRVTTYSFDAVGNQLTKQDHGGSCATLPGSGCTRFAYDANNQLTGISYSDGTTPPVTYEYDADGQRLAMSDGTGDSTWTWDSVHRLVASTDGASQAMAYDYDSAGNQTSVTYPGSKTVTRNYDEAGRISWTKDWFSPMNQTSYSYDDNSNLIGQTNPNSTSATYTADAADRLMGITHKQNTTTIASFTYSRDNANLLSGVTSSVVGTNETYTHNEIDQLAQVNSSTYTYDEADNLTKLADGTLQKYDVANQLCYSSPTSTANACSSPPSNATKYVYDTRGNRTRMEPPTAVASSFGYDQANRLISARVPSQSGSDGQYKPLSLGRILDTRSGSLTGTCYSPNNTSVTCGQLSNGYELTFQVTGLGGVPSSGAAAVALNVTAYSPSGNSNLVLYPSNASNPGTRDLSWMSGQTTSNTVIAKLGPDGRVKIQANNTTHVTVDVQGYYEDPSGSTAGGTYTPQVAARIADSRDSSQQGTCDPSPCDWLAANGITTVTVADKGNVPASGVSAVALTVTVTGTSAAGFGVAYPADAGTPSQRQIAFGNNDTVSTTIIAKLSSDGKIKLKAITGGFDWFIDVSGWFSSTPDEDEALFVSQLPERLLDTRDASRKGSCSNPSPCDGISSGSTTTVKLTGETDGPPVGATAVVLNLTALNTTANSSGGYLTVSPAGSSGKRIVSFQNGENASNLAIVKLSSDGKIVIGVEGTSASADVVGDVAGWFEPATETWTYQYNGDGLRTSKTSPNGTLTTYTWDKSGQLPLLVAETTGSNTTRYIYGPGDLPIEEVQQDGTRRHYHRDQLGSTRLLTDNSGTAIGTATFSAYGNRTSVTGTSTTPLGYAGQYTDVETGLQYLRARYYDPSTGVFVSRDPLASTTREVYEYTAGSPLNGTDPSGLCGPFGNEGCPGGSLISDDVSDAIGAGAHLAGDAVDLAGRCALDFVTCADNVKIAISPVISLGMTATTAWGAYTACNIGGAAGCATALPLFFATYAGSAGTYMLARKVWFDKGHDKLYHELGGSDHHASARKSICRW